jgi:hypothetical protein
LEVQLVNSSQWAQALYRAARVENGDSRGAWALARRIAGYLRTGKIAADEELAFDRDPEDRITVTRFRSDRSGKTKNFVMVSLESAAVPASTWNRLTELSNKRVVVTGSMWK